MSLADTLNEFAADAFDYEACRTPGCDEQRFYYNGRPSGHCERHGREIMRRAREEARAAEEARRASVEATDVTSAAKRVLVAARALDAAVVGVRRARERREEAVAAFREAAREMLVEAAKAQP